jgi:hypothetical protein
VGIDRSTFEAVLVSVKDFLATIEESNVEKINFFLDYPEDETPALFSSFTVDR